MSDRSQPVPATRRGRRSVWALGTVGVLCAALAVAAPGVQASTGLFGTTHPAARVVAPASLQTATTPPTNAVRLKVISARDSLLRRNPGCTPTSTDTTHCGPAAGDTVTHFKWLLQADNTGDPSQAPTLCHPDTNPNFPTGCNWPSIHSQDAAPVISSGTDADWSSLRSLPVYNATTGRGLKPGKYLVSVEANGYQLGGIHFSVPLPSDPGQTFGTITAALNPYPIPLATMRLEVFGDMHSADGVWEQGSEPGLSGFEAKLADYLGQDATDHFGNPICTQYRMDANGFIQLNPDGTPVAVTKMGGHCVSNDQGEIIIPNLDPNRYGVNVVPPTSGPNSGPNDRWIQTTTLEGNHDWDVWLMQNDTGNDTEMVVGGEPVPWVTFGFVENTPASTDVNGCGTPPCSVLNGNGTITGRILGAGAYIAGTGGLPGIGGANGSSGVRIDQPMRRPWVALTDLNNNDTTFFSAPAQDISATPTGCACKNADAPGNFTIPNVPDGDYMITVWDQPQEYAVDSFNVTVRHGETVDLGNVPVAWLVHPDRGTRLRRQERQRSNGRR